LIYTDLPLDVEIIAFPNIIMSPIYVIWSLIKLRQHSKNIAQEFSYTEKINLNWLKILIGGLAFVAATVIVSNILVKYPILSVEMHEHLNYLAVTITVFLMGYFGIKQQAIYKQSPVENAVVAKSNAFKKKGLGKRYSHSGLKKEEAQSHLKKLKEYFEKEQPYLDGKLSLPDVATKINITPNHLSQVINEQLEMTFYDFVNQYRVEEIKSRLADSRNQQFTLLAIAYDCGFNSKSSFNAIFKKFTDLTPSQFSAQLKN
jgi:AraC-like DNA-binding protein